MTLIMPLFCYMHQQPLVKGVGGVEEGENFFCNFYVRAKLRKFQWIAVITLQILLKPVCNCLMQLDFYSLKYKILLNPEHCAMYLARRFMNEL